MTARKDLTRWNRAGLHRLTYVDGNAPLFLDRLREALKQRFPDSPWARMPVPEEDREAFEPEVAKHQRSRKIIEQYYGERRDLGWEIARAVSRSCHVLAGHVDAHANEAYIRTATQWDNLRRLVSLIDYHPAAATSASTELVLVAKPGRKGTVKKGLQVKHTPPDGGPTVIFETLDDLEIDPDLNELRPKDWNRAEGSAVPGDGGGTVPPEPVFSAVARQPIRHIQGVGPDRSNALDALIGAGTGSFKIKDFRNVDPAQPGFPAGYDIPETWLRELKAKAIAITTFKLEPGWSAIMDWPLSRIDTENTDAIALATGKALEQVEDLKLRIGLIGAYLDQETFEQARLSDLVASENDANPGPTESSEPANGRSRAASMTVEYSSLALEPAGVLQGVGPEQSAALDSIVERGVDGFRVVDFLTLDLEDPGFGDGFDIPKKLLRLLKVRATAIAMFQLEPGWSDIADWTLAKIAAESPESLSRSTGKTLEDAVEFKSRIAMIGSYLEVTPPNGVVPRYPKLALQPASALQGVGDQWSDALDALVEEEDRGFKIKDFLTLDPADPGFPADVEVPSAPETWLREFKAKATAIAMFQLEDGWSDIADWMLPKIAAESSEALSRITGKTTAEVDDLKLRLELIGAYTDHILYEQTPLGDLSPQPEDTPAPAPEDAEKQFAKLALEPAGVIQGIGPDRSDALDSVGGGGKGSFKIKDFLALDPAEPGFPQDFDIPETWLREFKAKAIAIVTFQLEDGWAAIADWTLSKIATEPVEVLVRVTGKPLPDIEDLKLRLELVGAYLDHGVYQQTKLRELVVPETPAQPRPIFPSILEQVRLRDLIAPVAGLEPTVVRTAWQKPTKPQVSPGQLAMVFQQDDKIGEAATIDRIDEGEDPAIHLRLSPFQRIWPGWRKGAARLLVTPRWRRNCWLNGEDVIRTGAPHGLSSGAFVAWQEGGRWKFAEVTEADDWNLRLHAAGRLPVVGTLLYEARPVDGPIVPAELAAFGTVEEKVALDILDYTLQLAEKSKELFWLKDELPDGSAPPLMPPGKLDFGSFLFPTPMLPADLVKAAVEILLSIGAMQIPTTGENVFKFLSNPDAVAGQIFDAITEAIDQERGGWLIHEPPPRKQQIKELITSVEPPTVLFKEIPAAVMEELETSGPFLVVREDPPVKAVVAAIDPRYVFDGDPGKTESGDWVVGQFSDGPRALKVRSLAGVTGGESPETFSISFEGLYGNEGELNRVYGDFRGTLAAKDSAVNELPVDPEDIELDLAALGLDELPAALVPGRQVLLASSGDGPEPRVATIVDISDRSIKTDPPPDGFTKGNLLIRANVVGASHGARKPPKRLGRGVVAAGYQSLLLEVENVSSAPDPTFPGGTKADVEISIDGMTWTQVPRLNDSGPTDSHYAVRATEAGQLELVFGDGTRGRRLPAGANNVHVAYRVGAGRDGNLPAGSLIKQVNPHALVESVDQPRSSAGGEEMESVLNMRERAPATLLALERSVSLVDFENLAASRNDVWQAKAFHHPYQTGVFERVRVIVVPAGGGDLQPPLQDAIAKFLGENAVPTVSVEVVGFEPKPVPLTVTIRVDPAKFNPTLVAEDVRAALLANLAIERRPIGRPLYISEVYHVVEGVPGVSDSQCFFTDDETARLFPRPEHLDEAHVIHLDPARREDLELAMEDYVP